MTLSELFKAPPNIYYKVVPDHFFIHNDIVLNLVTRERINVDWTKPIRPQLNIPEDVALFYIFAETDNMMKAYTEFPTSIGWYFYNKKNERGGNIIKPINSEVGLGVTRITVCKYKSSMFSQELPIFEKVIDKNGDTVWKKIIWSPDHSKVMREIYHNGLIYEYPSGLNHNVYYMQPINPEVEPDQEKRDKIRRAFQFY
jgi:hypothetical protein